MKQIHLTVTVDNNQKEWHYIPDVEYADYNGCKRTLQLFVPYRKEWNPEKTYPLILFVPGSAWYQQDVYKNIPNYAKLAERGHIVAVVQYRESTMASFPAQIQDLKAAVRFLVMHKEEYRIDENRIFVGGNSSGGHTALLTAMTKAYQKYDSELYQDVEYEIKGVIAESAPADMMLYNDIPLEEGMENPVARFLGVEKIEQDAELAKAASCAAYVSGEVKLPSILLLHGTEDKVVPISESRNLFDKLCEADQKVTFYELVGAEHGGQAFWLDEILDLIEVFVRRKS